MGYSAAGTMEKRVLSDFSPTIEILFVLIRTVKTIIINRRLVYTANAPHFGDGENTFYTWLRVFSGAAV